MGVTEKEAELKDVDALIGDLEVKIEELKAAPPAQDLVSEISDHLLGQRADALGSLGSMLENGNGLAKEDGPVNDLTGMVRKKAPKTNGASVEGKGKGVQGVNGDWEKRKVDEEGVAGAQKRAKFD